MVLTAAAAALVLAAAVDSLVLTAAAAFHFLFDLPHLLAAAAAEPCPKLALAPAAAQPCTKRTCSNPVSSSLCHACASRCPCLPQLRQTDPGCLCRACLPCLRQPGYTNPGHSNYPNSGSNLSSLAAPPPLRRLNCPTNSSRIRLRHAGNLIDLSRNS